MIEDIAVIFVRAENVAETAIFTRMFLNWSFYLTTIEGAHISRSVKHF